MMCDDLSNVNFNMIELFFQPLPSVPATQSITTPDGTYVGKKRTAHQASPAVTQKMNRPKIPMEMGGKVAHNLRQKYLDKMIDELIPKCASEEEAYEKVCKCFLIFCSPNETKIFSQKNF